MPARIRRWRQDRTGKWWAELELYAPADAVHQVDGEDYNDVPREPATPPEAPYVLITPAVAPDGKLAAELHRADCWSIPKRRTSTQRVTPIPSASLARAALKFSETTACKGCRPEP